MFWGFTWFCRNTSAFTLECYRMNYVAIELYTTILLIVFDV